VLRGFDEITSYQVLASERKYLFLPKWYIFVHVYQSVCQYLFSGCASQQMENTCVIVSLYVDIRFVLVGNSMAAR
jgi:hypothetical protein